MSIGEDRASGPSDLQVGLASASSTTKPSKAQREGIAAAKADGRYKGRKPTARAKTGEIQKMAADGLGKSEIARRLGIGERSVYRVLAWTAAELRAT